MTRPKIWPSSWWYVRVDLSAANFVDLERAAGLTLSDGERRAVSDALKRYVRDSAEWEAATRPGRVESRLSKIRSAAQTLAGILSVPLDGEAGSASVLLRLVRTRDDHPTRDGTDLVPALYDLIVRCDLAIHNLHELPPDSGADENSPFHQLVRDIWPIFESKGATQAALERFLAKLLQMVPGHEPIWKRNLRGTIGRALKVPTV